jgi:aryl-alcohol dehydrogenase-like predicted oxidoreductase
VELIQVPASLVDRRLARAGFFERAAAAGREVFVRSIFLQGVAHLPAAQLPAALRALEPALATLDRAATSLGLGRATLFVAWARHALPGTRLVIGTETEAQLAANLADWEAAAGLAAEVAGLAAALPELDASVLDPWRWPSAAG